MSAVKLAWGDEGFREFQISPAGGVSNAIFHISLALQQGVNWAPTNHETRVGNILPSKDGDDTVVVYHDSIASTKHFCRI